MEEEKIIEECPQEEVTEEENTAENTSSEREERLEAMLFCMESGVSAENCGAVMAICASMDNKDKKEAIAEVLERYPFFKENKPEESGITTGVHIENTRKTILSGVEQAFYAANPDCI